METNSTKFKERVKAWYGGNTTVAFNNEENLKYLDSEDFNIKAQKMYEESLKEDHVDYRTHAFVKSNHRSVEPRVITDNNPRF